MKKLMQAMFAMCTIFMAASIANAKSKKMTYDAAKKECLTEDAQLKGKALQKCISKKRK